MFEYRISDNQDHSEMEMRGVELFSVLQMARRKEQSRRKFRASNIPKSSSNQSCIGVDIQKSEHKQLKKLTTLLLLLRASQTSRV